MQQQEETGSSIINIGSVSGQQASPLTAAYSADKAGRLQFTKSVALEWGPRVRVNHITIGMIRTDSAAHHYGEDSGASVARIIPMQSMDVPADVARVCLFLASPLAGYVTRADTAVHRGGEVPARSVVSEQLDS